MLQPVYGLIHLDFGLGLIPVLKKQKKFGLILIHLQFYKNRTDTLKVLVRKGLILFSCYVILNMS